MSENQTFEQEIQNYTRQQVAASEFIEIVNELWFNKTVEILLFRNRLVDKKISDILNIHQDSKALVGDALSIFETLDILKAVKAIELSPARVDIGKLAIIIREKGIKEADLQSFVEKELAGAKEFKSFEPKDVVLYGFGRIGRLAARELIYHAGAGQQLRLRAIVTRDEINAKTLEKRANLLRQDSIHGDFEGLVEVDVERGALIINGTTVYIISAKNPEEIDYTKYGINNALVIDNTGAFRDKEALSRHLQSKGASQVLLTAPGKGVPNVVLGVNEEMADVNTESVFSAASCTTNAITPVLAVMNREFGVKKGHIETIHSYTNDQNLVDNMHKKSRRGRAAAINMVITETGAGSAVAKALPELAGKLTSNAIRVPVPNGSLAILHLELDRTTSTEEVQEVIRKESLWGKLVEQIEYSTNPELVSSDIVGTVACSIFDAPATLTSADGKNVTLYVWYDNEYGYTHQVIRFAKYLAGVRRYAFY